MEHLLQGLNGVNARVCFGLLSRGASSNTWNQHLR